MAPRYDFKKQRLFIRIYAVAQVVLIGLLIYMAVYFQAGLTAQGRSQRFFHSVVTALVLQLALFYPINRFAGREARREIDASAVGLDPDELKSFRTKRMIGDTCKWAYFIFFVAFIYKAPKDLFVLSIIFFTFVLTSLSYFQCYNFTVKRLMKEKEQR